MFDTVKCEYPLPDPRHQDLEFQTKDLDCFLEHYTITRDGRLVRHRRDSIFDEGPVHDVDWPIHGDLRIHDSIERTGGEREWIEYRVRFTDGRVQWVNRLEQRPAGGDEPHVWFDAPPELPEPANPPSAGSGAGAPPALEGRRLTAADFTARVPEKLELIDGGIPGAEDLLLLLLTHLGLRQAAALVGHARWAAALPGPPPGGARHAEE